jgi:hypothetical protein
MKQYQFSNTNSKTDSFITELEYDLESTNVLHDMNIVNDNDNDNVNQIDNQDNLESNIQAKEEDSNLFPFIANKKIFNKEKDSVYYSGPYWDDTEVEALLYSILKGKWLSSGESVNKFETRIFVGHRQSLLN